MAFNVDTFKTRALTAVAFVIVMAAGLFVYHWTFMALFTIIHFGCWVEYQKLVELIDPGYATIGTVHKYGVMLCGWGLMLWLAASAVYNIDSFNPAIAGKWLFIGLLAIVLVAGIVTKPANVKLLAHSFFGLFYISLS